MNAHQDGKITDYVKRQYIGNLGKIESGIVSVNTYYNCKEMTLPLKFKVFKPKERLKKEDKYKTKPELIKELKSIGFKIKTVLADSLYRESHSNCINVIKNLGILCFNFILKWLKILPIPQLT